MVKLCHHLPHLHTFSGGAIKKTLTLRFVTHVLDRDDCTPYIVRECILNNEIPGDTIIVIHRMTLVLLSILFADLDGVLVVAVFLFFSLEEVLMDKTINTFLVVVKTFIILIR